MYKRIPVTCCALIIAITQSGCVGLIVNTPAECKNETPFTGVHDLFRKRPAPEVKLPFGLVIPKVPTPKKSSKSDFLNEWGKPDEVVLTSDTSETWIYKRKLWCGVIPVFILPVPLILPVCDGFDRIDFRGDDAKRLHTRRIVATGGVLIMGPGAVTGRGGQDPACWYPLRSENGSDSDLLMPEALIKP